MPFNRQPMNDIADLNNLESQISFTYQNCQADHAYKSHSHNYAHLVLIDEGIAEVKTNGQHLIAPRDNAIWVPQQTEHSCATKNVNQMCILKVSPSVQGLPDHPCVKAIPPLLKAVINHFIASGITEIWNASQLRLSEVLIEQLIQAPLMRTYLPTSCDRYLQPIIEHLNRYPGDEASLDDWAEKLFTTERTLARRFKKELNLTFSEWRQRCRFIHALDRLKRDPISIQQLAFDVGYTSPSAFIAMFRKYAGMTPEQYAKLWR